MAGYRPLREANAIHDSLYLRCIVIKNEQTEETRWGGGGEAFAYVVSFPLEKIESVINLVTGTENSSTSIFLVLSPLSSIRKVMM